MILSEKLLTNDSKTARQRETRETTTVMFKEVLDTLRFYEGPKFRKERHRQLRKKEIGTTKWGIGKEDRSVVRKGRLIWTHARITLLTL